jgi:hypothetical protein
MPISGCFGKHKMKSVHPFDAFGKSRTEVSQPTIQVQDETTEKGTTLVTSLQVGEAGPEMYRMSSLAKASNTNNLDAKESEISLPVVRLDSDGFETICLGDNPIKRLVQSAREASPTIRGDKGLWKKLKERFTSGFHKHPFRRLREMDA